MIQVFRRRLIFLEKIMLESCQKVWLFLATLPPSSTQIISWTGSKFLLLSMSCLNSTKVWHFKVFLGNLNNHWWVITCKVEIAEIIGGFLCNWLWSDLVVIVQEKMDSTLDARIPKDAKFENYVWQTNFKKVLSKIVKTLYGSDPLLSAKYIKILNKLLESLDLRPKMDIYEKMDNYINDRIYDITWPWVLLDKWFPCKCSTNAHGYICFYLCWIWDRSKLVIWSNNFSWLDFLAPMDTFCLYLWLLYLGEGV